MASSQIPLGDLLFWPIVAFIEGKLKSLFILVIMIYLLPIAIFRYSSTVKRNLIFMNHYNNKPKRDLLQPAHSNLKGIQTLRLKQGKCELGVWLIPAPAASQPEPINRSKIDSQQGTPFTTNSRPILLYVHGNGGNRGSGQRPEAYSRLSSDLNLNIVTFDYRGFGDSTYVEPTSDSLVEDARFVYDWLLDQPAVIKDRLVVWAHSLGTAVAVRMLSEMPDCLRPSRLVLESPFDSMTNAIVHHPWSGPFRFIPLFERFVAYTLRHSPKMNFDSGCRIGRLRRTSIMILHAQDDAIIPHKLGQSLYRRAAKTLGEKQIEFVSIESSHGLGHVRICTHYETLTKVNKFIFSRDPSI